MSNVILNSNQNSALVSTIRESESAVKNPVIYAEDTIGPPHSLQITEIEPVNTLSDYKGRTISFDLPKQGYLCRVALRATLNYTASAAGTTLGTDQFTPLGLLNMVESIELLSSGRRIQEFDKHTVLAKMSDQPHHFVKSYEQAIKMGDHVAYEPSLANDAGQSMDMILPLDFTFTSSLRHSLNMDFLEPLRLRIKFASGIAALGATMVDTNEVYTQTGGSADMRTDSITNVKLICEYRQLAASDADAAVQANFGSGQLTSLVSTFARAPEVDGTEILKQGKLDDTTNKVPQEAELTCNLTENAAVEAIYIMCFVPLTNAVQNVYQKKDGGTDGQDNDFKGQGHTDADSAAPKVQGKGFSVAESEKPIPLESIRFEASGQVLIDCNAEYLQHFGKRQDGVQRYAGTALNDDVAAYVYKLDFGYDNRFTSNVVSFRELSNPRITVRPTNSYGNPDKATEDSNGNPQAGPNAAGWGTARRSKHLDGYKPRLQIVYETKQLMTVSSANGRVNLSISN